MEDGNISSQEFRVVLAQKAHVLSQKITRALDDGKQKNPIYALDGVRAIACLCVISFHLNLWSYLGQLWAPRLDTFGVMVSSLALVGEMGIILFFILSGFLLFLPFAKAMLFETAWPSLRRFYLRRAFRILPGYYLALFLMALYLSPEYFQRDHWEKLWLFITFRMDLPQTYQQINPPFWTLAIEFQFYLLLPLIAWLMGLVVCRGKLGWRTCKLTLCLLGMLGWGILTRYWGVMIVTTSQWDHVIPHGLADALKPYIFGTSGKFFESFAIGMLIAMAYIYMQKAPNGLHLQAKVSRFCPLIFSAGLLLLSVINLWHFYVIYVFGRTLHFLEPYQGFLMGYKDVFMPLGFTLSYGLCLFAILHGPRGLKRPFEWTPLRWIGFISYSVYLWHDAFIISFFWTLLPKFKAQGWSPVAQYSVFLFWVVVTVFPLSITLYRWVEMPCIRLGESLCQWLERPKQKPEAAGALSEVREEVPVISGGRGGVQ